MANSNGWGDGASNNAIGWGQGANNTIGWGDSHLKSWAGLTDISGFDSSAISYFNSTGITGATQQDAIDNLVRGLKDDGIWGKMKAIYPFATDNRNLSSYSEDFSSNLNWGRSNVTTTANTIISPNGGLNATTATTTANANHALYNANPVATSTNQTFTNSIYLKYNNAQWITLEIWSGGAQNGIRLWVDVQNGVLGTANATVGTYTSSSITNVGNGWYRVSVTGVMPNATSVYLSVRHVDGNGAYNFTAVNGKATYIWGAQSEVGTLTAYQPIATSQQAYIASQFKFNLKDPRDLDAAFRLSFGGGVTYSVNGFQPNGTNGFANTFFNPVNQSLPVNDTHFSIYSRTNNITGNIMIGNNAGGGNNQSNIFATVPLFVRINSLNTPVTTITNINLTGLITASRLSGTQTVTYKNNTAYIQNDASTVAFNNTYRIGGNIQTAYYDTNQYAFSSIGNGLTDTEAANLYTRVQAFQTALSRQV
jgi:hypothetical protein